MIRAACARGGFSIPEKLLVFDFSKRIFARYSINLNRGVLRDCSLIICGCERNGVFFNFRLSKIKPEVKPEVPNESRK